MSVQKPLFIVAGFPERPLGNNPESLYSRLRELQVGQARQGRATQSKLRKTNLTLLKHNIFISDSFDISKDNERPLRGP